MKGILTKRQGQSGEELKNRVFPLFHALIHRGRRRIGRTVAVHFDHSSLQLAAIHQTIFKSRLIDISKEYIPPSLKSDEERRNFIANGIREYIGRFGTPGTRYILGVGGPKTSFRIITLPKMSGSELVEAIYWEGDKRVPYGLEKAFYGHHINENIRSTANETISASLLAVLQSDIYDRLKLIETLGIKVYSVHHELEAIGRMLPYIPNFNPSLTYALINVKKNSSEISFYRGTRLEFMHISSVGSETLSSGPDNSIKYEYFTETLVNEIQNSLDYYVGQFSSTTADTVFIYGDLSYSDELIANLTDRFGIQFKRFPSESWLKAQPEIEDISDQIPVSLSTVALALDSPGLIDFLPPQNKKKRDLTAFVRQAVPALLLVIAVLVSYWGTLKFSNNVDNIRLMAAEKQISMFRRSPTYSMYNSIKNQMTADRIVLEKLNQKPTILNLNLKELSRLAPDKIKLDVYDLVREGDSCIVYLTGHAISADPPPEIILAEFIARLQNSPFFKKVELNRHSKKASDEGFVIDFQLEMGAAI
ncbi:MAG: hypothetical protein AB1746_13705 [Candidatus Zixiibacteriota bacterium]